MPSPRLLRDFPKLLGGRRRSLHWLAAGMAAPALTACADGNSDDSVSSATGNTTTESSTSGTAGTSGTTSTTQVAGSCARTPSETAGPYPADGNGGMNAGALNVLIESGIVRSDIRSSFGGATATAPGVPLTIVLQLTDFSAGCTPRPNLAVYLWHCTRDGEYSLYSSGITGENFLRGVQVAGTDGTLTFQTIYPGCYSGRWPHIHFEVFSGLDNRASGRVALLTSQLAMPDNANQQVYGVVAGYESSASNYRQITLATDNVFRDDSASTQVARVSGNTTAGFTATLQVAL